MEALELKTQLIKDIEAIKDVSLIEKVAAFLRKEKSKDFADDLPPHVIEGIKRGKAQIENGEWSYGHEVLERLRAKL